MIRDISYSVEVDSDAKEVIAIEYNDGFKTPITKLQFETTEATIDWLGKGIDVSLTRDALSEEVFSGYVENVSYTEMPGTYEITCSNELIKARNHWIVMGDIDSFWTRENIAAETLIGDLLAEAGLTNYNGDVSSFTFGTNGPVEFNLLSVMDAIDQLNNILAYSIYMDGDTIRWSQTFPVPSGAPLYTYTDFMSIVKSVQTKNLRNKVVAFGKDGIYAEASAVSPYLPEGFYQTAIVSSQLIDTQGMASSAVNYNLQLYNKLGQELKVEIEGDPRVKVRDTVHITYSPLSIDEDWFVYSVRQSFADTFTTSLTLRK